MKPDPNAAGALPPKPGDLYRLRVPHPSQGVDFGFIDRPARFRDGTLFLVMNAFIEDKDTILAKMLAVGVDAAEPVWFRFWYWDETKSRHGWELVA